MGMMHRALGFADGAYRDNPALLEESGLPPTRRAFAAINLLRESLADMTVPTRDTEPVTIEAMLQRHLDAIERHVLSWDQSTMLHAMSERVVLRVPFDAAAHPEYVALLEALADTSPAPTE